MYSNRIAAALLVSLGLVVGATGQDDKKSKIPPLIPVGNLDGEIVWVDPGGEKMSIRVRGVVPQWVGNARGPQRLLGGGGQYVPQEKIQDIPINLSPDVKVRLMHVKQEKPKDKRTQSRASSNRKTAAGAKIAAKTKKEETKEEEKGEVAAKEQDDKDKKSEESAEKTKDLDAKLGGAPGKKSNLAKGQLVRVIMGRNRDPVNPQNYAMVIFVVSEGK